MNPTTHPPIIVFGMHRSGTTLVARLLGALGVFFGADVDSNGESFFFLRRNEWLLRRTGAAWDQPLGIHHLLDNPHLRRQAVELLRHQTGSWRFSEYLGRARYIRTARRTLTAPWGWKDPRMTFLLPLWLELFPDAKLVYVQRNGVDVALSLQRRQRALQAAKADTSLRIPSLPRRIWHARDPIEWYPMQSPRCHDLHQAFTLWTEYIEAADTLLTLYPNPIHHIVYEKLLQTPHGHLERLAEFCTLPATDTAVTKTCAQIRGDRAYSFMTDETGLGFYKEVADHPAMQRLGYGKLSAPTIEVVPEGHFDV